MPASDDDRLRRQIAFLIELDRLKSVVRQTTLADRSRRENSAEHSWHLAMFAMILAEHAEVEDPFHVVRLLLVHDIVEIDAGDAPIHAADFDAALVAEKERAAARRIFAMLPPEQGRQLHALWAEFDGGRTPAARFARALDRLQPVLLNVASGGGTWRENGVTEQQVDARLRPVIEAGSPALWREARRLIAEHFARATG